jgi:alanine racemase
MRPVSAPLPSQAILEIDLGAVVGNWRGLSARLAPGSTCAAVVKADAYGLGAAEVAPALAAAGCRDFFVAQIDEGVALRGALPASCRIFVLAGCLPGEAATFVAAGLVPVLNDPGQAETWRDFAAQTGRRLDAALHFDTGMSRLGFCGRDAAALAADPDRLRGIAPVLVMSHLARAEEDADMNRDQLARFGALRQRWPSVPASLANSSGIFLGPSFQFDLARPGAALYGINPLPGRSNPQRETVSLTAPVLQIRDIAPPETVGYGATFRAEGPVRVATIGCGYADGLPRSLSGRGHARFAGKNLPILGRISMDTAAIDAGQAPGLRVGDRVSLIGDGIALDEVAAVAGTIGYTLLTGLGRRFVRAYRRP